MFDNIYPHKVNKNNSEEMKALLEFFDAQDLKYESSVEYTVVFLDPNEKIVGTGSFEGNILKCIAVAKEWRERALFSQIVTHLVEVEAERGRYNIFVFTRFENSNIFQGIGLRELSYSDKYFTLFETGFCGIDAYQKELLKLKVKGKDGTKAGAIVVNCNPFTFGHRFLIESAASKVNHLYLIVVEEDRSLFPFKVRFELVKKGVKDIRNVTLIKGGKYVISQYTFPTYFLRDESQKEIARAQSELDIRLFARWIAPVLNIKYRFVGTEENCKTTELYNLAMKNILPEFGIELIEIKRKKIKDQNLVISASTVRNSIKFGDWGIVKKMVPKTTFDFLISDKAEEIIEKIKKSDSKH